MLRWFGVKTVYRTSTVGKPLVLDSDYDDEGTLVEERVVLVRARDHHAALKRAEWEAAKYAKNSHTNPYGQSVVTRRLKAIETFELYDDPDSLTEVWSSTRVSPASISNRQLVEVFFGSTEKKPQLWRRKKFLNRELFGDVQPPNMGNRQRRPKRWAARV